jgi:hypothetical protein
MKIVGIMMMFFGAGFAVLSLTVPIERIEGLTWKSRWVQKAFGRWGLRIYFILIGLLFLYLGQQIRTARF